MAAAKKFSDAQILDRLRDSFWANGYSKTSVSDLEAATDLNRSSLYASFGDKRSLFAAALAHYGRTISSKAKAVFAEDTGASALRRIILNRGERAADPNTPDGCLMTRAFVELGSEDSELGRQLQHIGRANLSQLVKAIEHAQGQRTIDPKFDPEHVAKLFMAVSHGLCVVQSATGDQDAPAQIAQTLVRLLNIEDSQTGDET